MKRVKKPVSLLQYILKRMKGTDFEWYAVGIEGDEGIAEYVRRCLKSYKPKR